MIDKKGIKTALWDIAGNQQFRCLASSYYRGSDGMILVFNVYDRTSFEALSTFIEEYQRYEYNKPIMLIGHHMTGSESISRAVSVEKAIDFGNKCGVSWMYFEVDAKISDENEDGNFKWPFLMFLSMVIHHKHDSYEVVR